MLVTYSFSKPMCPRERERDREWRKRREEVAAMNAGHVMLALVMVDVSWKVLCIRWIVLCVVTCTLVRQIGRFGYVLLSTTVMPRPLTWGLPWEVTMLTTGNLQHRPILHHSAGHRFSGGILHYPQDDWWRRQRLRGTLQLWTGMVDGVYWTSNRNCEEHMFGFRMHYMYHIVHAYTSLGDYKYTHSKLIN